MMKHNLRITLVLIVALCTMGTLRAGPVVFPFENRGIDSDNDWIGYGLAIMIEDMTDGLGLHDRLRIISEMDLPEGMPLTLASRIQVARKAGSGQLITGWFEIQDDMLQFEVQRYQLNALTRSTDVFSVPISDMPGDICKALIQTFNWSPVYPSNMDPRMFERYVKGTLAAAFYGRFGDLKSLQKENNFPELSTRLGEMLFHEGSYEEAMEALLEGSEQSSESMYLAGVAGIRSKHYDRALTCFLRALKDGTDMRCLINAAGCLMMEGKPDEALVVLEAVETEPADVPVQFNRAVIQAVQNKAYKALTTMKTFLETQRMTEDARKLVAYCCSRLQEEQHADLCVVSGDVMEGVDEDLDVKQLYRFAGFERLDQSLPDVAALKSFYLSAGKRNVADGNLEQAADNLHKVLYLDPVHREALQLMCDYCNDAFSCEILKRIQERVSVATTPNQE